MRELLSAGADVAAQDAAGLSVLHIACGRADVALVEELLDREEGNAALLNARNSAGQTALLYVLVAHVEPLKAESIFLMLLDAGADFTISDYSHKSPLWAAAAGGHAKLARRLIMEGASTEDEGAGPPLAQGGSTLEGLLQDAVEDKREAEQEAERRAGMAQNAGTFEALFGPAGGDPAAVQAWLEGGGDVRAVDDYQSTPLMLAAMNGHTTAAELLLDAGSELEAYDENYQTALILAAMKGHLDAVRLLVDRGADVGAIDAEEQTAESWAAMTGHSAVADFLRSC